MTGEIIQFILLLIAHAAAGIYSSALKYSKKTTYIIWGIWVVVQAMLLFYTEFVLADRFLQFFVGFVLSIAGQYVIFFATTTGKFAQRVFTMLTYSVLFCIGISLVTMANGTFPHLHWALMTLVHALLLFMIVYYFLRSICPLCRTASKNITTGWTPLIFVNIVFIVMIIFSTVFPVRLTSFYHQNVITFVFISISVVSVYPVIFSNINSLSEAAEKREMERQNKLLLAQIEAETALLASDSQARHDRRHHNLVLLEYANNNDIESVREYLKNLVENENMVFGMVKYCNNLTVNTVLSVYERRAVENGLTVKISANASGELDILPQDLVIVIANLFENAIHATEKLKDEDKTIKISVKENLRRLVIQVENPCRTNLVFDESHYGVGIHSVISAANKYDGMYDFSAENGIFAAKVSLNLK